MTTKERPVCDRCMRLEQAILDIDAKATPYGPPIIENGEEYVRAYLMPAGPLHRALGLVGHSAVKVPAMRDRVEIDAASVGMTLKQKPTEPDAPTFRPLVPVR